MVDWTRADHARSTRRPRADIEKFERLLADYLAGEVDEDAFRVFRLNNGIYGQRQGGHNQMVRIKVPYGSHARPTSWSMLGHVGRHLQPGLGTHHHPAERPVPLRASWSGCPTCCGSWPRSASPPVRRAATPSATSWAATWPGPARSRCSTSARGPRPPSATSCTTPTPSGCPGSSRSTSRAAPPTAVRPCSTTWAIVAVGPAPRGRHRRARLPGLRGRRPRAPTRTRPRRSRSSRPARSCWPRSRPCLRTFDHYGNRDNKLRARMKWLVDQHGHGRAAAPDPPGAQAAAGLVAPARRASRRIVQERGDAPAGLATGVDADPGRHPRHLPARPGRSLPALGDGQRRRRRGQGHRLGHTPTPSSATSRRTSSGRWPPSQRDFGVEVRVTNRQNVVFRDLSADAAADAVPAARRPSAWPSRVPSWPATWSACPGADTCNLAVTQSRGLADDIGRGPRGGRPGRRRRRPHQHLRLHQLAAASTTSPTSASSAPSGGPTASPPPATRCCSAATSATPRSSSARRRCGCRPRPRPRPPSGWSAASPTSGRPARPSPAGSSGSAEPSVVGTELKDLDVWPDPEERPDYYIDFDETGPYVADVGEGECAAT